MRPLVALLIVVGATGCRLEHVTLRDIEIVEFGTFRKTDERGNVNAPDAVTGQRHAVADAVLLENTTEIHATRGTSFGLRVRFVGKVAGMSVPYTVKYFHPKFTDPSTGRTSDVEQWESLAKTGQNPYIGYTFDNDWELVPGDWTIQVSVGSRLKAEKTFHVIISPTPN